MIKSSFDSNISFNFFFFLIDTIIGRQAMASSYFLSNQFDEVLVYLNSIKVCFIKRNCNMPFKVYALEEKIEIFLHLDLSL